MHFFFSLAACDEISVFSAKILLRAMHTALETQSMNLCQKMDSNGLVSLRLLCKCAAAARLNGHTSPLAPRLQSLNSVCAPHVAKEKRTARNAPKNKGQHQEFSGPLCMCSRHENRVNCLCDFSQLWFKKGKRLSCTLSCFLERALSRTFNEFKRHNLGLKRKNGLYIIQSGGMV